MNVFGSYSRYYNLLYRDKDYRGEVEYVDSLIRTHCPGAKSVLDLGCGTGRHDVLLAEKGYEVTGVDMSEDMLAVANSNISTLTLAFLQGDVRTVRVGKTFDVVMSLFHVMSYQTTNEDLQAAFATARAHLGPGGIFIFDCWYGPGVLTDPPAVRVKRLSDEEIEVVRIAEPAMHPNENVVDVNYQVLVRDKATQTVEEIRETHRMRYLFRPELELFLMNNGMRIIKSVEWMTDRETGFGSWSACFVVRP